MSHDPRTDPRSGDIVENNKTYRHVSTAHDDLATQMRARGQDPSLLISAFVEESGL